jgi:hypothetical protein
VLRAGFVLGLFFGPEDEDASPKRSLTVNGLHSFIPRKIGLFKSSVMRKHTVSWWWPLGSEPLAMGINSIIVIYKFMWGYKYTHICTSNRPFGLFQSELFWNVESHRQSVGLLGRVMSRIARPLPIQDNTNREQTRTDIHVTKGIQTRDPSVRAGEDNSWLRTHGHIRNVSYLTLHIYIV